MIIKLRAGDLVETAGNGDMTSKNRKKTGWTLLKGLISGKKTSVAFQLACWFWIGCVIFLLVKPTCILVLITTDHPPFSAFTFHHRWQAKSMNIMNTPHYPHWGVSINGGTPNSWMVYIIEHPSKKWMISGGTPISGHLHILIIYEHHEHDES